MCCYSQFVSPLYVDALDKIGSRCSFTDFEILILVNKRIKEQGKLKTFESEMSCPGPKGCTSRAQLSHPTVDISINCAPDVPVLAASITGQ